MITPARQAAYRALFRYRKTGARSDEALVFVLSNAQLSEPDAALTSRIVYGVVQNMRLLDYYISAFSSVKLQKMQPQVLDILRLSVYQLVFLSKIPSNAAVSEGVELAKKHAHARAASFVNAVLRKIAGQLETLPEVTGKNEIERLATRYSHPTWLVQAFVERLGIDETAALLQADNSIPDVTAVVNISKATITDVIEQLRREGVTAEAHETISGLLTLYGGRQITRLQAFQKGLLYIQDPASYLSVLAAAPIHGGIIIDGCAAPGGKSFAVSVLTDATARIQACDVSEQKVRLIRDGAERLGFTGIEPRVQDARTFNPALEACADLVIADVPCSGFGVIRKKPEIRYKTPEEIAGLPALQSEILANLSRYVKPGGILMYTTCTLLSAENEDVVQAFIETNNDFSLEGFELPMPVGAVPDGMTTIWPHRHGTDGFFISRLRRRL